MRFLIVIFLFIFSLKANSQSVAVGSWRFHPSLANFNSVAISGDHLYAGSDETILKYDFTDNSVDLLSKEDGFSDVGVSKVAYNAGLDVTVFGYINGNIDLLKGNQIINIGDIKRKSAMTGSKRINHISFDNEYAYLSTDFGLVILDLTKEEIKEAATNIGPNGSQIKIYSSTINKDSIFLATEIGVLVAAKESNLLNFNNWLLFTSDNGIPTDNVIGVVNYDDSVYALVSSFYETLNNDLVIEGTDKSGLYKYESGNWKKEMGVEKPSFEIGYSNGNLFIAADSIYYVFEKNILDSVETDFAVNEVKYGSDGKGWIAGSGGVYNVSTSGEITMIRSNTLSYSNPFKLSFCNDQLFCLYGGYHPSSVNFYNKTGFETLNNGLWENFSVLKGNFPGSYDLVDAAYNKQDDITYIASYGYGLFSFKSKEVVEWYFEDNSPLVNLIPKAPYIRVTNVEVDSEGQVWVANVADNVDSNPVLHCLYKGEWKSYPFPLSGSFFPSELVVDYNGNKWIKDRKQSGIYVFNETNNSKSFKRISTGIGNGNLPDGNVSSIAVDNDGAVWLGTGKGVAVLNNTSDPFSEDFTLPYFDGFPLLMDKEITAIEIDGGNRKWIGTKEGIWLFNEDGTEVIEAFTEENSPLPSNDIKDIEVQGNTGEVFILTGRGLVSFGGSASEAEDDKFSNVKVYPNPVKESFEGYIGISGLANNAPVKITDVFGNLIYETEANGGMAIWNGRNYNGEKAESGVYLIFSATADGEEGNVAKVAIIK